MGDDINSVRSADIYGDLDREKASDPRIAWRNDQLKIKNLNNVSNQCGNKSVQNGVWEYNKSVTRSTILTDDGKKSTATLFKCLAKSEENVFNVVANRTMLETEIWKTQMALYDELVGAEVKEREEKLKQVIKYEELLKEVEKLKVINAEKETKINELVLQNTNLKKNICSLYKTAKTEIERKDCLLLEANSKLDSFRFYKKNSQTSLHENQAPKSNVAVKGMEVDRFGHKRKNDKECENSPDNKRRSSPNRRRNYSDKFSHNVPIKRKSSTKSSNQIHSNESKNKERDLRLREHLHSKHKSESDRERYSHFTRNHKILEEGRIISLRNKEPQINHLRSSYQSKLRQSKKRNVDINNVTDILALKQIHQNENLKHGCVKEKSLNSSKNDPDLTITHDQPSTITKKDTVIDKNNMQAEKLNCVLLDNNVNKNSQNQCTYVGNIFKTERDCNEAGLMSSVLPSSSSSKLLLDHESSTIINGLLEFEQNENFNSVNEENNDYSIHEKTSVQIFKDGTTTNALFFGLIPLELRLSFMEYETKQSVMMNKLKQSLSDEFIPFSIEFERNNILTMNKLKQTFVIYFFSHEKDIDVNNFDSSYSNDESLVEKEQIAHNKKDTDSPLFFFEPPGHKSNSNHASSKLLPQNETVRNESIIEEKTSNNGSSTERKAAGNEFVSTVETAENKLIQVEEIVENESAIIRKTPGNESMNLKETNLNKLVIVNETAGNDMVIVKETTEKELIASDKIVGEKSIEDKVPGKELAEDIITQNEIVLEHKIKENTLTIRDGNADELMVVEKMVGSELRIEEADKNETEIQNLCHNENSMEQCDILFLLNSKSKNTCSQDDDTNTDSTKEIPTAYREIFKNHEKSVAIETINVTRIENTALTPATKINNVDPTYSGNISSACSSDWDEPDTNDDEEFHRISSNSEIKEVFPPSLNSVYCRRQLLKVALEEKAAGGLSKGTNESVAKLYKFRKNKVFAFVKRKENIFKKQK